MSGNSKGGKGGAGPHNFHGKGGKGDPNSPLSGPSEDDFPHQDAPGGATFSFEDYQRSTAPFPTDFPGFSNHLAGDVPYKSPSSPELRYDHRHPFYDSYATGQVPRAGSSAVDPRLDAELRRYANFESEFHQSAAARRPEAHLPHASSAPTVAHAGRFISDPGPGTQHTNRMLVSENLNNPDAIPPETLEIMRQMTNPHKIKCAQFGNIALRHFHTREGSRQLKSMLTDHQGVVDPFIFIRLQNVNPVSVMGDEFTLFAHSIGLAIYKGFFGCIRSRLMERFRVFCQVINSRYTGPRACKAMIMPEINMVSKLGREITDALMFEAEQLDIRIALQPPSQNAQQPAPCTRLNKSFSRRRI